jgi:pimeloyl-ACP methyl ester carboxylesterase
MKLAQKIVIGYFRTKLKILSVISKKKAAKAALDIFCTPLRKPKNRTSLIFSKAEDLNFDLENCRIHGYRWNHPASKKILVLHGFESSSKNFERYIIALIKKDYEVLAFDAPAHGNSTGKQINLPLYLATVKKIHELYGPVDSYVTHSYGGLVITQYLENIKHDGSTRVVLIAPATETVTTINLFFRFLYLDKKVRKEFDSLIHERSGSWPAHFSIRRAMNHINAEVLWFHDEDDELTPVEDALTVKSDGHPNIHFRITKGLGHRMIYKDAAVIKEILEFL